jgi:hypothetical protein
VQGTGNEAGVYQSARQHACKIGKRHQELAPVRQPAQDSRLGRADDPLGRYHRFVTVDEKLVSPLKPFLDGRRGLLATDITVK